MNELELVEHLKSCFDALSSTIPDIPPKPLEDMLRTAGDSNVMAPVIGLDGQVIADETELLLLSESAAARRSGLVSLFDLSRPKRFVVAAAVAACVALAATLVPIVTERGVPAAAAILRATALRASAHGVLAPLSGQVLEDTFNIAVAATQNDSSGAESASASFQGELQEWTSADGIGHEQVVYGSPEFPTPADQRAWVYGESLPVQGSIPYTTQGPVISLGPAVGAFDVSSLPTDPGRLAAALAQTTTEVRGLDQIQGPDVVFHRVALLLSTPLLGSSPAFVSALYQVLADMPRVESLGTTSDHSGRSGVAFTEAGSPITLIVDTQTGSLLELLENPTTNSFPTSGGAAAGTETLLWLDPSGEQLVSADTVPPVTRN